MGYGRAGFTVLNYRVTHVRVPVAAAAIKILDDDPNRYGARIWAAGANSSHVVIGLNSAVAVAHTWSDEEEIATWNNPVVIPWWDKRERWAITRDAAQELVMCEYTDVGQVP